MSCEVLQELLFVVMDNEVDELELCWVLSVVDDVEICVIWLCYQVVCVVMYKELLLFNLDIVLVVFVVLVDEVVLVKVNKGLWCSVVCLVVVVLVIVVVLVGVWMYNQDEIIGVELVVQQFV